MRSDCPVCHHECAVLYRKDQDLQAGGKRDVYLCAECKCLYPRPRMEEGELLDFVFRHYACVRGSKIAQPRIDLKSQGRKRWIQPRGSFLQTGLLTRRFKIPKGNALDIGASTGDFCAVLESLGFAAYGLELFDDAVKVARERGINVFNGAFPKEVPSELSNMRYTLITILETIYNMVDLRGGLRKVREMLEPNGYFLIKCHQGMSIYYKDGKNSLFKRLGDGVQAIPTLDSLNNWLKSAGFEVVYIAGSLSASTYPFRINERFNIKSGLPHKIWTVLEGVLNKIYEASVLNIQDADQLIVLARKGSG